MKPGDVKDNFYKEVLSIREKHLGASTQHVNQTTFNSSLGEIVNSALEFGYRKGYEDGYRSNQSGGEIKPESLPDFEGYKNQSGSNHYNRPRMQITNSHRILVDRHNSIINTHDDILEIDLKEKKRYLLFRLLTAVGIAVVVLGTAWIAHKYNIPLPLSGVKQVLGS